MPSQSILLGGACVTTSSVALLSKRCGGRKPQAGAPRLIAYLITKALYDIQGQLWER